jgi:uncharacterized protein (TIGR02265 family)
MTTNEIRIKGQAIKTYFKVLDRMYGAGFAAALEKALGGEFGHALQYGGIVTSGWYPIAWYRELHAETQRLGHLPADFAREIGRVTTQDDLKGIYSFVVRMFSPQMLLSQAQRIYRMYYDRGDVTTERTGPTSARLTYSNCTGMNDSIFEEILGGSAEILRMCGGKDIEANILARQPGAMTIEYRWRED